jgi:hypothetical protein
MTTHGPALQSTTARLLLTWAAAGLLAMGIAGPLVVFSQSPPAAVVAPVQAAPTAAAAAQTASRAASARATASAPKGNGKAVAVAKPVTKPLWRELSTGQQQALAPLAAKWDTLNEAQKRKWLVLSVNYPKLSGEEQAKLHSRMTEWVTLSPQQRSIARLNYGESQKISPDDKKAKWEAYQALSPEEKHNLASRAAKPPATAAAVKPVAPEKLASVPKAQPQPQTQPKQDARPPRIAAAPHQVDSNTLLPQHPPQLGTPD